MGDDLWQTRLRWYSYNGCAKLHGKRVSIDTAPVICGDVVVSIDYIPEVGLRQIQLRGEGPRDMRPDEIAAADEMLRTVCGDSLHN